jgi:hypothetical protein
MSASIKSFFFLWIHNSFPNQTPLCTISSVNNLKVHFMLIQGFPNLVLLLGEPGFDDDFCRMTLKFGYIFPLYELCNVCVCEGFVMCGCFGNMYTVLWLMFFLTWLRFFFPWQVFPCFFLSCKANARVKLAKTGHGPHSSTLIAICVVQCIVCV